MILFIVGVIVGSVVVLLVVALMQRPPVPARYTHPTGAERQAHNEAALRAAMPEWAIRRPSDAEMEGDSPTARFLQAYWVAFGNSP